MMDDTECIRCGASPTDGYPDLYCRDCIEHVAWAFKRSRDGDNEHLIRSQRAAVDRRGSE